MTEVKIERVENAEAAKSISQKKSKSLDDIFKEITSACYNGKSLIEYPKDVLIKDCIKKDLEALGFKIYGSFQTPTIISWI